MRYIDKDAALEAINDAPQFQNPTITKFDVAMFLNSRPGIQEWLDQSKAAFHYKKGGEVDYIMLNGKLYRLMEVPQ